MIDESKRPKTGCSGGLCLQVVESIPHMIVGADRNCVLSKIGGEGGVELLYWKDKASCLENHGEVPSRLDTHVIVVRFFGVYMRRTGN